VFVGGTGVSGTDVAVSGTAVLVADGGIDVGVFVGGIGVLVGGTRVLVGISVGRGRRVLVGSLDVGKINTTGVLDIATVGLDVNVARGGSVDVGVAAS
jgi:hypothetical protein